MNLSPKLFFSLFSLVFFFHENHYAGKYPFSASASEEIDEFPEFITHLINGDTQLATTTWKKERELYEEDEKKEFFKLAIAAFFEFHIEENYLKTLASMPDFKKYFGYNFGIFIHINPHTLEKETLLDRAHTLNFSSKTCREIGGLKRYHEAELNTKPFNSKKARRSQLTL